VVYSRSIGALLSSCLLAIVHGAARAQPADIIPLKMVVMTAVTNLPAVIAPNYAKDFGLSIEVLPGRTPQDAVTASLRGDVDLFTGVPTQVIQARDVNLPLVIFSGAVRASTQLLLKSTLKIKESDWAALKAEIKKAKDSGTKFPFGSPIAGSTNYATCYASLLKNGIDLRTDLDIVPLQDFPSHATALGKGNISMLCTAEPFATIATQNGTGSFFANPYDSDLGDQLGSINTSEKILQDPRKREGLRQYVRLFDSLAKKLKTDKTFARDDVMKRFGMSTEGAERALERTYWDQRLNLDEIAALAKFTYSPLGQTRKDWSCCVKDYVDVSFIKEIGK
jgi:ABC-type nitrate/sulfonate/bicarbonate transport system substrate-binding protein